MEYAGPAVTTGTPDLKRSRLASAAWLAAWIALAAWTCHFLATAWPYVQLMPQWLLVFAMPGLLFRAIELAWMQVRRQRLQGWTRRSARAIAVLAGLFAAGGLWSAMDDLSMARFESAMAPLVAQVHANSAAPCPPAARYTISAGLAGYIAESGVPRAADLAHDKQRFVLALNGASMDIDGSSIFYDARSKRWRKVHNDMLAQSGELEGLRKGLETCRIALQ